MRWPLVWRSTATAQIEARSDDIELREWQRRAHAAEDALEYERKRSGKLLAALLRLKADGTLSPKRGPTPPQAVSDPIGLAIEAECAKYPRPQRAALAAHLRDHVRELRARGGLTDEQIAAALREERAD